MSGCGQAASSASRPIRFGDVGRDADDLAARARGDLRDGLVELLAIAAIDDHVDAFGRQRLGARSPEPLARRADDGQAAADPQIHRTTLDTLPVARQCYGRVFVSRRRRVEGSHYRRNRSQSGSMPSPGRSGACTFPSGVDRDRLGQAIRQMIEVVTNSARGARAPRTSSSAAPPSRHAPVARFPIAL